MLKFLAYVKHILVYNFTYVVSKDNLKSMINKFYCQITLFKYETYLRTTNLFKVCFNGKNKYKHYINLFNPVLFIQFFFKFETKHYKLLKHI